MPATARAGRLVQWAYEWRPAWTWETTLEAGDDMKTIELSEYGDESVLGLVERDSLEPPLDGRLRVRVEARDVNPVDLATRAGVMGSIPNRPFPIVLGWDFAGTMIDAGAGLAIGQRVLGMIPWFADDQQQGSYAEEVTVQPGWIAALPDSVAFAAASTMPANGLAALQAVEAAAIQPGDTVLVTGASGAVGGFVTRLLVGRGKTVFAVASNDDEHYVASLGAGQVLKRGKVADLVAAVKRFEPGGVDVVIDTVPLGPQAVAAVKDGGRFVTLQGQRAPGAERGITVTGVRVKPDAKQLTFLVEALAAGRLSTRIAGVIPLEQAGEAHRLVGAGQAGRGKVVLTS